MACLVAVYAERGNCGAVAILTDLEKNTGKVFDLPLFFHKYDPKRFFDCIRSIIKEQKVIAQCFLEGRSNEESYYADGMIEAVLTGLNVPFTKFNTPAWQHQMGIFEKNYLKITQRGIDLFPEFTTDLVNGNKRANACRTRALLLCEYGRRKVRNPTKLIGAINS